MEDAPENDHIGKHHVTITESKNYMSKKLQLKKQSSTFIHEKYSLFSATSIISRSLKAYNTAASLGELTCTNYRLRDLWQMPRYIWTIFYIQN